MTTAVGRRAPPIPHRPAPEGRSAQGGLRIGEMEFSPGHPRRHEHHDREDPRTRTGASTTSAGVATSPSSTRGKATTAARSAATWRTSPGSILASVAIFQHEIRSNVKMVQHLALWLFDAPEQPAPAVGVGPTADFGDASAPGGAVAAHALGRRRRRGDDAQRRRWRPAPPGTRTAPPCGPTRRPAAPPSRGYPPARGFLSFRAARRR